MKCEIVVDLSCRLGENPLWNAEEAKLYWTDILAGRIYAYDPATGEHEEVYSGESVGGFTFQRDGALLLFGMRGSIRLLRDGRFTQIVDEIAAERETRFNDVIADPRGRVYAGTIPANGKPARLYRIDTDGSAECIHTEISPDGTKLYHTDSGGGGFPGQITVQDYDAETGALSDRRAFHVATLPGDIPDGMTIDAEGGIWSARHGIGRLVRYLPDGSEDMRIEIPAGLVTSCAFGGPDLGDLYITSAGGDMRGAPAAGEWAGALFRVRPGVCGVPEFRSAVRTETPSRSR